VHVRRLSRALATVGVTLAASARSSRAQSPGPDETIPVAFGADEVRFDPGSQSIDAAGHVRVDEPPFHFTSRELRLRRVPIGVVLEGQGRLAFCPCLGTPLAVHFSGATLAPPYDVILRNPVLEVFGIPVAWLPIGWLRSPGRIGLLPPDLEWRGIDGFFAGGGVHVPWSPGDRMNGLDVRAGGYVEGGVVGDVNLRTATTMTHVRWDRLHGSDGVTIRSRGAVPDDDDHTSGPTVAWDVDALRGARAVAAVTDVATAAQPFDRAQAQAEWRSMGWMLASGVRAVAVRATPGVQFAGGPVVAARRADALATVGTYDLAIEGGQVGFAAAPATVPGSLENRPVSFARGEAGLLLGTRVGPAAASLALRTFGDLADNGTAHGAEGAAQTRITIALPLARGYASEVRSDPWVHRTEPRVEIAAMATHSSDIWVEPAGRGMPIPNGRAWVAEAGWSNAVGRWGSRAAAEIDVAAGAVGHDARAVEAVRARATIGGPSFALRAEMARTLARAADVGGAVAGALRIGSEAGMHIVANVAGRDGLDPILARALTDPSLEPSNGFLDAPAWTGGARVGVPLGSRVTARAGADVDLEADKLVAASGALEMHDPCNCVVLRATGAHRIGRPGIDVWISVDLPIAER